MGKAAGLCKVVDGVLFVYFIAVAIVTPLFVSPVCLPGHVVPSFSVEVKTWYAETYDDYLMYEEPHFFVGLLCLELFFYFPLALASIYAMATHKSWFTTTSLVYGVSVLTASVNKLISPCY